MISSLLRRPLLTALVASLAVTACSDSTSPEPLRSGFITASTDQVNLAQLSNTTINFKQMYPKILVVKPAITLQGDTTIQVFKIDPKQSVLVQFGKATNYVHIPARSVCDLKSSGYGPSYWLAPCTLASGGITVTVKSWLGIDGRPHAEFSPDLRFSPAAVPPTLYFLDTQLTDFSSVIIPYCDANNACVNEGANDPLLTTFAAPNIGGGYWVFRALRHFSGYNVTAF